MNRNERGPSLSNVSSSETEGVWKSSAMPQPPGVTSAADDAGSASVRAAVTASRRATVVGRAMAVSYLDRPRPSRAAARRAPPAFRNLGAPPAFQPAMRLIALAAASAVLAILAAVPASAQKQNQPGKLSISATPNPVKFGRAVAISGKRTGPDNSGIVTTLREDPFPFDVFTDAATTATDAQGDYSFTRRPAVNTRYQTTQGAVVSEVITVTVSPRISLLLSDRTPEARTRVRFSGRVCPEHDNATLRIQRRVAPKQWRTIRRTRLADAPGIDCSTYSRELLVRRDSVWRTFLPGHADHAAGASRARRIDVH